MGVDPGQSLRGTLRPIRKGGKPMDGLMAGLVRPACTTTGVSGRQSRCISAAGGNKRGSFLDTGRAIGGAGLTCWANWAAESEKFAPRPEGRHRALRRCRRIREGFHPPNRRRTMIWQYKAMASLCVSPIRGDRMAVCHSDEAQALRIRTPVPTRAAKA